ncbi:unnamed protein product [Sphagnum troendelagicum]|uniref:Uncharacterized protein n=1 Tax=Sphagnum troendelagicum TaxID=128251 RepID=A0ABP0V1V9_9BRYO
MTQVVGVGLEWAKVVVTKELDVEVREIGEHAWKCLWEDEGCEELDLIEIILPMPETKVEGSLNTRLEDQIERFGIGLTKSDVIEVSAENHLEQFNEGFFPLVYDLVEYMGLEGENSIRCKQVSGGEGGSSKGAAKVRCSIEKSGGKKDVHQDPSQDPHEDGFQDGFQGPPQDPSEPLFSLPLDMEEKKVLLVSIIPLWGYPSSGLEIGGTFEPTIVGEWDGLDQSRKCNYIFKTQRDIISIKGFRQSHGSGQEPECIKQGYELPLWVNHSMTHILHRHEIKELRAPKVNILKHVIGAKPALRA